MSCKGLHCPGCGDGGGGLVVVLVLVVIVIAAIARPVEHAADAVGRFLIEALEIVGIVLASAAGVAAVAGLAVLAARIRRHRTGRAGRRAVPRDRITELELQLAHARAQLENGGQHIHLHGMAADDITAIISRQGTPGRPSIKEDPCSPSSS